MFKRKAKRPSLTVVGLSQKCGVLFKATIMVEITATSVLLVHLSSCRHLKSIGALIDEMSEKTRPSLVSVNIESIGSGLYESLTLIKGTPKILEVNVSDFEFKKFSNDFEFWITPHINLSTLKEAGEREAINSALSTIENKVIARARRK